jgi:hypothetical protein
MGRYLLETDQVACYAEDGRMMACNGTGQDAATAKTQDGLTRQRFSAGSHVVEDRVTGAIWTRDANPFEFPRTWHEALAAVAEMRDRRKHGLGGWRLPSRDLLFSILSHQRVHPAIVGDHPFTNIFDGYYWTQDSSCRLPDQAWYVHLGGGRIHRGMKHGSYLVWPVCLMELSLPVDGRSPLNPFGVSDETVQDHRTGLTWTRDANPFNRRLTWEAALAAVDALNASSLADRPWCLPNIRELESLLTIDTHSPALPDGHPFVNVQDAYWSSTTSLYEPRYAWTVYFQDGNVGVGFKPDEDFYAWPVRRT